MPASLKTPQGQHHHGCDGGAAVRRPPSSDAAQVELFQAAGFMEGLAMHHLDPKPVPACAMCRLIRISQAMSAQDAANAAGDGA